MGQKTNSISFRLGNKHNEWNSKYFELNNEEFTRYNYQNIEIQKYLKEILNKKGLFLQKCKLHFNENNMYIFISYFSTKKSSLLVNKEKINLPVKFNNKKNKKLKSLKKAQTNLRLNQFLKDLEPKS